MQQSDAATTAESQHGPNSYQVIIALLVLAIAILGLFYVQETNDLKLNNRQLISHSSNQDAQLTNANKILTLQKTDVLANRTLVDWPGTNLTLPLSYEDCTCFQYSGYLAVTWTTNTAIVRFRLIQFDTNLNTPSGYTGTYKLPVSSADVARMEFARVYCPIAGCGQITYTLVYHY